MKISIRIEGKAYEISVSTVLGKEGIRWIAESRFSEGMQQNFGGVGSSLEAAVEALVHTYMTRTQRIQPEVLVKTGAQDVITVLGDLIQYAEDTDALFADQRPNGWKSRQVVAAKELLEKLKADRDM